MFSISSKAKLTSEPDLPLIVGQYDVLLEYDSEPILFTGVNKNGGRVIGSSVEESHRTKVERFFHLLVSPSEYLDFLRRKRSYRDLILRHKSVFVVDQHFSGATVATYWLGADAIPPEYMPHEDSYCPQPHFHPSLMFGASLNGKIADYHQADPADLRVLETCLPGVVRDALGSLGGARLESRARIQPYAEGSFRVKFDVVPYGQLPLIPSGINAYKAYAVLYVEFCLNHFQAEFRAASGNDTAGAPNFRTLLDWYMLINNRSEAVAQELLAATRKSVERLGELAAIVGGNFTSVQLFNLTDGSETLLGYVDQDAADELVQSADEYDSAYGGGVVEDSSPGPYEILIYNLNVETRRGQAYVVLGESFPRVRFTIEGSDPLEQTDFTASIDKSIKIRVTARGTRVADKIRSLTILYQGKSGPSESGSGSASNSADPRQLPLKLP